MGKRSNFKRNPRDYYKTPYKAIIPLVNNHILGDYYEPCAGDGTLINHLTNYANCVGCSDIQPNAENILKKDMFSLTIDDIQCDTILTNPPWKREILHPMLEYFIGLKKRQILLFDADWKHTIQSSQYMDYCEKIISIGRLKWIEKSKNVGKDNCCWYIFNYQKVGQTIFVKR
jgi:hypothetical protein